MPLPDLACTKALVLAQPTKIACVKGLSGGAATHWSGWVLLALAALVVGGVLGTSSIQPGAVNAPILGAGLAIVVLTVVAYLADRSGRSWGRGLGLLIGTLLIVLAALAEWFFWIGDVQGTSYQKIEIALIWAAIGGTAAAGVGLLATRGDGRVGVAALVLATVLLPAGIGQLMVWSSQQPQVAEPTPSIPAAVADREPLSSCGTEATPPDGPGSEEAAARKCLLEAFRDGRSAELRRDYKTDEGDVVAELVRVLADGSVEIFVDATRDPNGTGAWTRRMCEGIAAIDGPLIFELVGCGEPAILR